MVKLDSLFSPVLLFNIIIAHTHAFLQSPTAPKLSFIPPVARRTNKHCHYQHCHYQHRHYQHRQHRQHHFTKLQQQKDVNNNNQESDFSFAQRIESLKTLIVGALAGGIALTPFSALHDILLGGDLVRNGLAQWEFDTDMGSIEAGLFAIVYRYCVRNG